MNIAILFRGKIRGPEGQEIQYFKESVRIIKESFKDHNVTTYLTSWNDSFTSQICQQKLIDHMLITPEPTMELCARKLSRPTQYNPIWGAIGTYALFYGTRCGLFSICNDIYDYDYVCMTRPDIQVSIKAEEWFTDKYIFPNERRYPNINDQFSVAKPIVAYNAWDFKNLENLKQILSNSYNHEDAVSKIMSNNNVSYEAKQTLSYKFKW